MRNTNGVAARRSESAGLKTVALAQTVSGLIAGQQVPETAVKPFTGKTSSSRKGGRGGAWGRQPTAMAGATGES